MNRPPMKLQTIIVHKSVAGSREEAHSIAKEYSSEIYSAKEKPGTYHFRVRAPENFVKSSFRSKKVTNGVTLVLGHLK